MSPLNSDPTASFIWLHVWTHSRQDFVSADTETHAAHTRAHTRWRTRRVPKLAKSDIYLPLHIDCYAVRTSLDVSLTHTEEFLRAKSLYSPVSHSSGPLSLLMVCRGWGGFEGACGVFFFFCRTWTFFTLTPLKCPRYIFYDGTIITKGPSVDVHVVLLVIFYTCHMVNLCWWLLDLRPFAALSSF